MKTKPTKKFWDAATKLSKKWGIIITIIGFLVITIEYGTDFFSSVGNGFMNAKKLMEVADTYQQKVDSVRIAFHKHDRIRRNDSARTVKMFDAIMDTIHKKERMAKRFARVSTEIDIGEMIAIQYHGYTVWATNHQAETGHVPVGWYIYRGEPYKAVFNASLRDYFIEVNGIEVNCKDL